MLWACSPCAVYEATCPFPMDVFPAHHVHTNIDVSEHFFTLTLVTACVPRSQGFIVCQHNQQRQVLPLCPFYKIGSQLMCTLALSFLMHFEYAFSFLQKSSWVSVLKLAWNFRLILGEFVSSYSSTWYVSLLIQLLDPFPFFKIYLKDEDTEKGLELLVHSPNACNGQGWVSPRSLGFNPDLPCGWQGLKHWSPQLHPPWCVHQ